MSKAVAKKIPGKAGDKKQGGGIGIWVLTVLLLILGGLMLPSSVLLAAGMLPTLVAVLTDLDPLAAQGPGDVLLARNFNGPLGLPDLDDS